MDPVLNFAKVEVSTGYDASATSIVLQTGEGAKLPDPSSVGSYNLTWWNFTDYPDPSDDPNKEIVRVTARSTDTLTVSRAQEGTSASTKNTGGKTYKMVLSLSKKTYDDIYSSIPTGYKISTSISSDDLVVTLLGPDGNAIATNNPVRVVINGIIRTITAPISITLADGTNYFDAGSSRLATREIDYFVYLGWDSSNSAVRLCFARVPNGLLYSDFSGTNTNEKYLATSGNLGASDAVVNIGRFNATLSASASYLWTIPATSVVVNHRIFHTRLLKWLPNYTGFSSAPGAVPGYKIVGNIVFCYMAVDGTSNSATFDFTLPILSSVIFGSSENTFCGIYDATTWQTVLGVIGVSVGGSGGLTAKVGKSFATAAANAYGGFTTSGGKGMHGQFNYHITP